MEKLHWTLVETSLYGNIYQGKLSCISSSIGVICWVSHPTGSRQFPLLALTTAPVLSVGFLFRVQPLSFRLCLSFVWCFCCLLSGLSSPPTPLPSNPLSHLPRNPTADGPHLQGRERHLYQSPLVTAQHHSHHWLQDHSGGSRREYTHLSRHGSANDWSLHCLRTGTWYRLWHQCDHCDGEWRERAHHSHSADL